VINIPEKTWTVRTTDQPGMSRFGFGGGRFKLHRVKTKALAINVAPKPAEFPTAQPWLPAQSVHLEEQWSRSPDEFRVGEPITRTVTIRADGAAPEQLPPLFDERGTPELKFYPDKPDQDKQLTSDGVNASRTESVAIVPNRAGDVTLPEVSVSWWNTAEKRVEKATLPARTLHIAPAEGQGAGAVQNDAVLPRPGENPVSPASAPLQATHAGFWPWVCGLLLLTNLITLLLLWWQRSHRRPVAEASEDSGSTSLKEAAKRVRQACERRDAAMTRIALLEWAQLRWGGHRLLQDIGKASGSADVQRELTKLEAVLFAGAANDVGYPAIARAIGQLNATRSGKDAQTLPALYKAG